MSDIESILKDVPWISVNEIEDDFFREFVRFNSYRENFNLPYKLGIGDNYPEIAPCKEEIVDKINFIVVQLREYKSGLRAATLLGEYKRMDETKVRFTSRADNSMSLTEQLDPENYFDNVMDKLNEIPTITVYRVRL